MSFLYKKIYDLFLRYVTFVKLRETYKFSFDYLTQAMLDVVNT